MNSVILNKSFAEPPVSEKEILRYAGCRTANEEITALMSSCLAEASGQFGYKVCYGEFPVTLVGDLCDFGAFRLKSKNLAENLKPCRSTVIFAATIGVGLDRMIAKYGYVSPSKALMLDAIGAERIEALCDAFCDEIEAEMSVTLRPRFSPGYGDLPLDAQRGIFSVLDCGKRIGVTLNDSLLMSPSKSVTAFAGIVENK